MIELTQIKTTDQLGALRGQLNTAFSEIQSDQPFIGRVVNPSINLYKLDGTLVSAITASNFTTQPVTVLGFVESNGCYIWQAAGALGFTADKAFDKVVIDVPAVKFATRTAAISTFVSPSHLGLSSESDMWDITSENTIAAGPATILSTNAKSEIESIPAVALIEQTGNTCNIIIRVINRESITPYGTVYVLF